MGPDAMILVFWMLVSLGGVKNHTGIFDCLGVGSPNSHVIHVSGYAYIYIYIYIHTQNMCVFSWSIDQLPLCGPMDCSLPGSSVHGIFHERILERGAISYSIYILHIHYIIYNHIYYMIYIMIYYMIYINIFISWQFCFLKNSNTPIIFLNWYCWIS